MILYILIYISIAIWFFNTQGKNTATPKQLFVVLMGLALFVGLGDMLGGYDRYIYCELFDRCTDCVNEGRDPFDTSENPIMGYRSEIAYVWWNVIISHITLNRYIYILLTTIAIYITLFFSIKKHAENYPFAVLLFMGLWFFFSFTYLRQVMAASVAWLGYRFVINKKWWLFIPIWYLSYRLHNSAIIFLPFGFMPLRKYSKNTVIIILTILLIIGASGLPMSLYGLYGSMGDNAFEARASAYGDDHPGFRWDYLFEVIVFMYFIFKKYDRIDTNNRTMLTLLNASYLFCAVLLFFIMSSNAGRQSWYYLGGLIFLLTNLYAKEIRKDQISQALLLVCFALFLRIVFAWGILLSPYKTFLTNGHRAGDPLFLQFEYDFNYDDDKFYRDPWILW